MNNVEVDTNQREATFLTQDRTEISVTNPRTNLKSQTRDN